MTLTSIAAARAIAAPVNDLGGRWMLHKDVLRPSKDAGYPNGFVYYVVGRGGVLGDVDADVVVAAFSFFEPGLVRTMWEQGVAVEGARASAVRYRDACAAFGRARLADFGGAARLAELAERVARSADVSGLALFAGWRAEPLPDDAPARAFQLLHVLRELRGGLHIVACVANGLSPRDAVLTEHPEAAKVFGWPEPHPDTAGLAGVRAAVDELTDRLAASTLDVLTDAERSELVDLVEAAQSHLDAAAA